MARLVGIRTTLAPATMQFRGQCQGNAPATARQIARRRAPTDLRQIAGRGVFLASRARFRERRQPHADMRRQTGEKLED